MVTEDNLLLSLAVVVGLIHFLLGFENHTLFLIVLAARCSYVVYDNLSLTRLEILIGLLLFLAACFAARYQLKKDASHEEAAKFPSPLRPLIFPCRTTHTRLFPKKHSFSYSYLMVGIPIGWTGSVASIVGADEHMEAKGTRRSTSWFNVQATDYLERGNGHLLLRGKLAAYLESEGDSLANYSYAYLVTAPRFLGYSFNPVSFWYLFSTSMNLRAMILEVNNTFDERRIYYMKSADDSDFGSSSGESRTKFTNTWFKDFHVSPFNSRKGAYSLAASNPFPNAGPRIDNTITLKSSKDHAKLIARIYSAEEPIDPSRLSSWQKARLILAWCWVGFMTFPRIVKEAGKLFFQRKLHVWFRPEVIRTSIGRKETSRERIIEQCFREYLKQRVEQYSGKLDVVLTYCPACTISPNAMVLSPSSTKRLEQQTQATDVVFQVLSPLFYAEAALGSDLDDYLVSASKTSPERRVFDISDAEAFADLISGSKMDLNFPADRQGSNPLYLFAWKFLSFLRGWSSEPHPLDAFARSKLAPGQAAAYRKSVTSLLLANRIYFGMVELLDMGNLCIGFWFAWTLVGTLEDHIVTKIS